MASEVYLDALPYIDQGYEEPGVREAVSELAKTGHRNRFLNNAHRNTSFCLQAMQLVEEETRRYRPSKNYLEFLQPPKATFEVCTRCTYTCKYSSQSMRVLMYVQSRFESSYKCTRILHSYIEFA